MWYGKSKEIEIIYSFVSYSYFLFTDKVTLDKEKKFAKSDLGKIIKKQLFSSADAFLSQCISEVNEELLVLDFGQFKHTTRERNEMDIHLAVAKSGNDDLLVHPIMQAFLDIKWRIFRKTYWLNMLVDLLFAISLTLVGHYFIGLTHCHQCDENHLDWNDVDIFCRNTTLANGTIIYENDLAKYGLKCEKNLLG